jgi:hypothetical protein
MVNVRRSISRSCDAGHADMVWIPGGTFRMGSEEFYVEERPVHEVAVDGFWIDRRATSRGKTSSSTVMREVHRLAPSRRTAMGCTTWLGTSGNGPLTGTSLDTRTRWSNRVAVRRSILGSSR